MPDRRDVVVIGAGPVGLACAIEVRRRGLSVRVIDKGTLVNSIFGYPTNMEFFSTPDLIEIGGYPFPVQHYKPTREDALEYYRGVATREAIELSLSEKVKYWIKPDLENRIKEGSITAFFSTTVQEIRPDSLVLNTPEGARTIANQWVLAMTGYRPDFDLLHRFGVTFADDGWRTPLYDETTFETRRPGVYVAGTVCGGLQTGRWFIENGRFHARQIAEHIAGETVEHIPFEQIHWKTQE